MARRYPIPLEELRLAHGDESSLRLDTPLEPTDEAVTLLMLVAEVEHVFLLQYLYAAYSVRTEHPDWSRQLAGEMRGIRSLMLELAREEMGHLMTVQNLLIAIGAPVHFERDDQSEYYPMRFALEPLTSASLAKYIAAERPATRPPTMPESEWATLTAIETTAQVANGGVPVRHLERVLHRLVELLSKDVPDRAFYTDTGTRQAQWNDWGYDAGIGDAERGCRVHVEVVHGTTPDEIRTQAVAALRRIAGQGEGALDQLNSHFHRLMALYVQLRGLEERGIAVTWPVAVNPTVSASSRTIQSVSAGATAASMRSLERTTPLMDARARAWASLGDIRYRALLGHLVHFLALDGPRYIASGVGLGDRTARGLLLAWAFEEMQNLRRIASKLVQLPVSRDGDARAGLPFRAPAVLLAGDRESARWRTHLDVALCTVRLLDSELLATDKASVTAERSDPFLTALRRSEEQRISILRALAAGQPLPRDAFPQAFAKVGRILEQAVRGADVGAHGKFWANIDRDGFVDLHLFGLPLIGREPRNRCYLSPEQSSLIWVLRPEHPDGRDKRRSERMPRFRPPLPASRLAFLRQWIARQAPDNAPPGRTVPVPEPSPEPTPEPSLDGGGDKNGSDNDFGESDGPSPDG